MLEGSLLPGDECLLNLLSAILSAYIAKGTALLDLLSREGVCECMTKKSETQKVKKKQKKNYMYIHISIYIYRGGIDMEQTHTYEQIKRRWREKEVERPLQTLCGSHLGTTDPH